MSAFISESLSDIDRNRCPNKIGTGVRLSPEYAGGAAGPGPAAAWNLQSARHPATGSLGGKFVYYLKSSAIVPLGGIPVVPEFLDKEGGVPHLRECKTVRSRFVVCSRSSRLAATSSVNASHNSMSSFSFGSKSFSLRNTRHVASAVRLLPSTNG